MSSGEQLTAESLRLATPNELHDLQMKIYGSLALGEIAEERSAESAYMYDDATIRVRARQSQSPYLQSPINQLTVEVRALVDERQRRLKTVLPFIASDRTAVVLDGTPLIGPGKFKYGVAAAQFALQAAELKRRVVPATLDSLETVMHAHAMLQRLWQLPADELEDGLAASGANPQLGEDPLGVAQPTFFDDFCTLLSRQRTPSSYKYRQTSRQPQSLLDGSKMELEILHWVAMSGAGVTNDVELTHTARITSSASQDINGYPTTLTSTEAIQVIEAKDASLTGKYSQTTLRSIAPLPDRLADYARIKQSESQLRMHETSSGPIQQFAYDRFVRALT